MWFVVWLVAWFIMVVVCLGLLFRVLVFWVLADRLLVFWFAVWLVWFVCLLFCVGVGLVVLFVLIRLLRGWVLIYGCLVVIVIYC